MTNETIEQILRSVIKKEFPEIDMNIHVIIEPDLNYMQITNKMIYGIYFNLSDEDYTKYVSEGQDKHVWDKIRELIRDLIKMLGIWDKVNFYFLYK